MEKKRLTSKDVAYISDIFNWNIVAAKKIKFYSDGVEDEELLDIFNELYDMHDKNLKSLMKLLESGE